MATSLNHTNLHSKSYANASKTNINAGTNTKFTAADFQRWNQTTSVVHIPSRLVRNSKIPQLRKELINAVGERRVSAVQALSPIKYNIQFKKSSDRHAAEINGIAFRGVQLTLLPAYEEVKSVFVEKAPLQMQDNYLYEALAPYGRVIGVQHLAIKGFPSVRSGTRRVSMVVTKAIPRIINIGGFPVVFNYRGQPTQCYVCQAVGHASKDCPKSRQGRKQQPQQQQQNLPKATGKNNAQINSNKSTNKAINNNKPALGHDDLKIKLDGAKRTVQTQQNKKKSPLGETDLRIKLNKKQETKLIEQAPAPKSPSTKSKAGRAKGQSLPKGQSSATDDVTVYEVARSPKAVAELMDTQPSQETSLAKISTSPPAKDLAELRKIFNIPAPSDEELEPGEIRDSSSIQSMDDERSSDHADPEIKLDGAVKTIQLTSEADDPSQDQSHMNLTPLTRQIKQLRSTFNMPITSHSESEEITEADFAASIIAAEQQAAAKSGPVRTALRTVTTLRVRRRRSGLSQAKTPATITTTTTTSRSSSTVTTSTWTKPTGGRAKVTATQAEIDRDDIPLAVLRSNKRRRLDSKTSPDEELDHCLSGSSVIDPLAIEYWQTTPISSFGHTSSPALEAPGATLDRAPQQQQQQQQPAEDLPLAIPAIAPVVTALDVARPEPEVTPDPMATPLGVLMQEEEEILIQVREEGEVFWASQVTSDLQGTPPLIGVEIGIVEPNENSPDPSLIYDPLVCPLTPQGTEMSPISAPAKLNTPVFYRPSVDGDESPPGSVASSTDFLPSPESSQGLFERLVSGAPVYAIQSANEPTTIDEINRALLTELSSPELPLSPEFLPIPLESNDEFDFSQH